MVPTQYPLYLELPAVGQRCRVSGLSLTALQRLAVPSSHNNLAPPVRSKLIKYPGCKRGRRMIETASLLHWLEGQE